MNFKQSIDPIYEFQPPGMCFGGDGGGPGGGAEGLSGGSASPAGGPAGAGLGGAGAVGPGVGGGQGGRGNRGRQRGPDDVEQERASRDRAARAKPVQSQAKANNPETEDDNSINAETERRRAIFRAIGVPGALADPRNSLF